MSAESRYVMYASSHREPDTHRRLYVPVFTEVHTARSWLEAMINGKPYETRDNLIVFETSPGYTTSITVTVRSDQLHEILRAPRANEDLREDYLQAILRFKYGTWEELHLKEADTEVEDRAERPIKPKRDTLPDGYTTITQLCQGTAVLPTHARAALRSSNRTKPSYGWAFAPNDLPEIKKLIGL